MFHRRQWRNVWRWFVSGLTGCLVALPSGPVDADEAPAVDRREQVIRLIEQLDAPQAARRNAAEQELIELGEPIRSLLPADSADLSAETRQRLTRIRQRLRPRPQPEPAQTGANDVRLAGAATLGAALEAISRDSRVEFVQPLPPETAITPYDSPLPFWHALDYVLDQADLDIDIYGGDAHTLRLQRRRAGRPSRVDSAAYAGIYRLEPTMVTSRRVLRQDALSGLSIEIELAWQPGITPIGVKLPLSQLSATFNDQQRVQAQSQVGSVDIATGREIPLADLHLPLQLPAGQPGKITALSGRIQSLLPGAMHRFEFPLHTVSVTETADSVKVQLEEVRKNGELHEVRLGVEFESPGAAMESHRGFLLDNEVFVLAADGTRLEHLGYQLYRQSQTGIGIAYLFDVGPTAADAKLVYSTPSSVVQNGIDFVIDNIPLP